MDNNSYQLIFETLAANQFTSRLQLKLLFNTNIGSNERDGTFSGKHKTVFHYFVLDLTAVTLGFDFFYSTQYKVNTKRVSFPPFLASEFPLRMKLSTMLAMVCPFPSNQLSIIFSLTELGISFPCTVNGFILKIITKPTLPP